MRLKMCLRRYKINGRGVRYLILGFAVLFLLVRFGNNEDPTVYKYFFGSAKESWLAGTPIGLKTAQDLFILNGKPLRIVSGAIHYFRVHPEYWRDRLKKLRAMGANTVETYMPWQLHEPKKGTFDFGQGGNDMSMFLDFERFLRIAKEEDLLALIRPGPYICSEWDFGGFPSWLQRDPFMSVRTNYTPYLDRVKIYFDEILPRIANLQFTRSGPIIGVQVENEYGSFDLKSKQYLEFLYNLYEVHGITGESLMFTSDGVNMGYTGTLPDKLFMTANFASYPSDNFNKLKKLQPNKPVMAMELWSGWFDHWKETHHTTNVKDFASTLEGILNGWKGSVNFYMFHGGTNFGFMAGANHNGNANPTITSYDYDAPLSESGDYTPKYQIAKKLIEDYQVPKIKRTEMVPETLKTAYPPITVKSYLTYFDIIEQVPEACKVKTEGPLAMENLPINGEHGQSYGYIVYRKRVSLDDPSPRSFEAGPVKDFGLLIFNGQLQNTGFTKGDYWINSKKLVKLNEPAPIPVTEHIIDLFIENTGRVNYGSSNVFLQWKGLYSSAVYKLNNKNITNIEIISLEFKSKWVKGLKKWKTLNTREILESAPVLVKFEFEIEDSPTDTFLDMSGWHKGIVFVNGFNIGRYFRIGPQQTLYVPAPLLKSGNNEIIVFEQLEPAYEIIFSAKPILDKNILPKK